MVYDEKSFAEYLYFKCDINHRITLQDDYVKLGHL